ncbi:MAG: DUF5058 family protein [Anaerolineaceae bacterium]|nr:DUF5058 family protein [Anaerolineaceae bacterium]
MDWKVVANEPWIWICGGILAAVALYQCTYFMIKAIKIMKRQGMTQKELNGVLRGSAITSIGPILSELFVMVALVVQLSPGFAWQREGAAVGSVFTELIQASNAATGVGQEFGGANFNLVGFSNVVFVMNVACIGWLLITGLFTPSLGKLRNKIGGGDATWLSIFTVCATLGIFGYYSATYLVKMVTPKNIPLGISTIGGAILSVFFFKLADWIKVPRLKEWALGLAMFGGMIIAGLSTAFFK